MILINFEPKGQFVKTILDNVEINFGRMKSDSFEMAPKSMFLQSGQNIWNRIGKSGKTGQGKKSLISTFACFVTATAEV